MWTYSWIHERVWNQCTETRLPHPPIQPDSPRAPRTALLPPAGGRLRSSQESGRRTAEAAAGLRLSDVCVTEATVSWELCPCCPQTSDSWSNSTPLHRCFLSSPPLAFHNSWFLFLFSDVYFGIPGSSDGKESACNAWDSGLIPRLGRSPGKRNGNPRQCSCLENPMDRGAWWATFHGSQGVRHDKQLSTCACYEICYDA